MFEIRERFTSRDNKKAHYEKHVLKNDEFGNITEEDYEKLADDLAYKPVDYKTIFGYYAERKDRESVM